MSNGFITVSNTGSIGGGLKLVVAANTWRMYMSAPTITDDLAGLRTLSIGAITSKKIWEFTAYIQKVGATGYVSLDAAGQSVLEWSTPPTDAKALLKMTDIDGTAYDVLWASAYAPEALQNYTKGNNEWYKLVVRLVQQ